MPKTSARRARPAGHTRATTGVELAPIVYRVAMPDPRTHEFHVEMQVPGLAPEEDAEDGADTGAATTAELVFPAWAPGSYMVRDFVRHVYGLTATDARGRALPLARVDKTRWRVEHGGRPFIVRYRVFAFEATVRTSFLDTEHGYGNGTSLFFFVEGQTLRPCHLRIDAPRGWRVSLALPELPQTATRVGRGRKSGAAAAGTTTYVAGSYDELVDSPFEVGTHQVFPFRVGGVSFELALQGRTNAEPRRLVDILRRVVAATAAIFDAAGQMPFARYVFIVHALPVGSGGLEHRASVTMDISGLQFEDEKGYHRFADLAAHEFFHAWNVKRLHDPVLGPFDYTRECYTRLLWFHEGFTDYLANVIILRAGAITEADFWRWIGEDWPKYASRPGRNVTPLDELSFEAWIKQYKPAENYVNSAVSYYEKGLWVGMALDLTLREATGGRAGLPELFRRLWQRAGKREAAVTEADIRAVARELAGRSLDGFFERYVHGTAELDLVPLWRRAGVKVQRTAPYASDGGEPDATKRRRARAWSGAVVAGQAHPSGTERAVVRNVIPGSPAFAAGLTFGDEIVAVDGDRVNAATFAKRLGDHPPGTTIAVSYFRRDRLREARVRLALTPERKLTLAPEPSAKAGARALRKGWLGVG